MVHLHGFRRPAKAKTGQTTLDYINWKSLEKVAIEEGFILVQPAALKGQWRLFDGLKNVTHEDGSEADNVSFIFGLVASLIESGVADQHRIYLTGISDGAIMSFHLMRFENSPFIATVAIVGSMYEKHTKNCHRDDPPAVMVIAGTNDLILPYDGWLFPTGRELSVTETLNFWRLQHGCTGQKAELLEDVDTSDNSRVRIVDWTGCKRNDTVRLLRLEGAGHVVPDLEPASPSWIERAGGQNRDISGAAEAWKFLKGFHE